MIPVDFHVHSLFSQCGLHTILELLTQAKQLGMKGFAITDHGLTLGGRLNSVFFERFKCPDPDFLLYKGIECNIIDDEGGIDLPRNFLPYIDIVLLGIHPNCKKGLRAEDYTGMLIKAMHKNPQVDIITHPNDPAYPVDYDRLAKAAAAEGVTLELNNSKICYSRSSVDEAIQLLTACKTSGCFIAVNSDTHAIHELGDDSAVLPLIKKTAFPTELILNYDPARAAAFVAHRLSAKRIPPDHR